MSTLDATVSMLELLPEEELRVVQKLVKSIFDNKVSSNPFQPLSEEQLYSMLSAARKQADNGEYDDVDVFYNSMVEKYGM